MYNTELLGMYVYIIGKRASQEDACVEDGGRSGRVLMLHRLFEISENHHHADGFYQY